MEGTEAKISFRSSKIQFFGDVVKVEWRRMKTNRPLTEILTGTTNKSIELVEPVWQQLPLETDGGTAAGVGVDSSDFVNKGGAPCSCRLCFEAHPSIPQINWLRHNLIPCSCFEHQRQTLFSLDISIFFNKGILLNLLQVLSEWSPLQTGQIGTGTRSNTSLLTKRSLSFTTFLVDCNFWSSETWGTVGWINCWRNRLSLV